MPVPLPRDRTGGERSEESPPAYDPERDAPEDDAWDHQVERDAEAGRLDERADRARAQIRTGNATDLHGTPVDDPVDREAQRQ